MQCDRDMTLHARDLMQTDVTTVSADTPLLQVHRLFAEEEINGAPVLDDLENLVGVISSLDLVRAVEAEYESARSIGAFYLRDDLPGSGPDWVGSTADFQDRLGGLTAADAMVTEIVSVGPDAPIDAIARLMRDQRIHRVLVVDGGLLLGIVTTFDLIGVLARPGTGAPVEARP
jgi:CBS domain-containing protein